MSLTVSGYAMIPFEELCSLLGEPDRAAALIEDAVARVSPSAVISVPSELERSSSMSARLAVHWQSSLARDRVVDVAIHSVQEGWDPITEVTATVHGPLEPSERPPVARALHRVLDLLTAELEHSAARP